MPLSSESPYLRGASDRSELGAVKHAKEKSPCRSSTDPRVPVVLVPQPWRTHPNDYRGKKSLLRCSALGWSPIADRAGLNTIRSGCDVRACGL